MQEDNSMMHNFQGFNKPLSPYINIEEFEQVKKAISTDLHVLRSTVSMLEEEVKANYKLLQILNDNFLTLKNHVDAMPFPDELRTNAIDGLREAVGELQISQRNILSMIQKHHNYQVDENRKISRRVDNCEENIGLIDSTTDDGLAENGQIINRIDELVTDIEGRVSDLEAIICDESLEASKSSHKEINDIITNILNRDIEHSDRIAKLEKQQLILNKYISDCDAQRFSSDELLSEGIKKLEDKQNPEKYNNVACPYCSGTGKAVK